MERQFSARSCTGVEANSVRVGSYDAMFGTGVVIVKKPGAGEQEK